MSIDKNFNKMDYAILEQLVVYECFSLAIAFSIKTLAEKTGFSQVKIRQTIKLFLMFGIVEEGAKDGNKKTYYVTKSGLDLYKRVMDYTDEDIIEMQEQCMNKEEK